VHIYPNPFLRYKYLLLGTYHPDTVYFCEQGWEDPWLFFEAKGGPRGKKIGETLVWGIGRRELRGKTEVLGHKFVPSPLYPPQISPRLNSVRTSQETHSSVIKTSQLMLYGEIIAVCSEKRTKYIHLLCWQNV